MHQGKSDAKDDDQYDEFADWDDDSQSGDANDVSGDDTE